MPSTLLLLPGRHSTRATPQASDISQKLLCSRGALSDRDWCRRLFAAVGDGSRACGHRSCYQPAIRLHARQKPSRQAHGRSRLRVVTLSDAGLKVKLCALPSATACTLLRDAGPPADKASKYLTPTPRRACPAPWCNSSACPAAFFERSNARQLQTGSNCTAQLVTTRCERISERKKPAGGSLAAVSNWHPGPMRA